ncbi:hypothetical protein [Salinibacter altiplanensis]|uniref:hypothetical protein n=1 Tax=Salinibacter altiplanensis TaxID=1803181 RepID=UPI00131A3FC6|nr:hypothetical protein [Salinibacter altiplanensis]
MLFAAMNALKAVETLRLALFSMAKTLGFVFAVLFIFSSVDFSRVDPATEGAGTFDMAIASISLGDLALLAGVPAGLFLLGCASSLWEKKLRESRQACEKESLREALERFPPEGLSVSPRGPSGGGSEENSSPEDGPPPPPSPPPSPSAPPPPVDLS